MGELSCYWFAIPEFASTEFASKELANTEKLLITGMSSCLARRQSQDFKGCGQHHRKGLWSSRLEPRT